MNGEMRNAYKILVGKPEGKRQLVRPKHRRENDLKIDLKKSGTANCSDRPPPPTLLKGTLGVVQTSSEQDSGLK
jgi:hypothetical protein